MIKSLVVATCDGCGYQYQIKATDAIIHLKRLGWLVPPEDQPILCPACKIKKIGPTSLAEAEFLWEGV